TAKVDNLTVNTTLSGTGFDNAWKSAYNATTTLNGFNPANYLLTSDFASNFNSNLNATTTLDLTSLQVTKATTTNFFTSSLGVGSDYITDLTGSGLSVVGGALTVSGFGAAGQNGAWQTVWTNALAPTSTTAGIFVNASSTFNSTLRVNDTLTISPAASSKGLVVQAASGATANLFQLQNSSGAFLSGFTAAGGLLMNISSTTAVNIQNGSGSPIFQVNSASTEAGVDVTAVAAQSANLLNLFNSSSVFLSGFTASGGLLMNISSSSAVALQNGSGTAVLTVPSNSATATTTLNTGLNLDGNTLVVNANENRVAVGVTNPAYKFMVDWNGDGTNAAYVNNSNAWTAGSADYAEFFYSDNMDLKSGEAVCVDITKDNAVKRCERGADPNIMGIISTSPAVLGNAPEGRENDPHYAIVGMLGQVPAFVSNENGEIRPGDSLTAASSTPGYIMKANAGDSTVGVALESLTTEKGKINVLISRRNKSLTVEQIEEEVTKRVSEMEIEDEVNIMVAGALDKLEVVDQVAQLNLKVADLESSLKLAVAEVNLLKENQLMEIGQTLTLFGAGTPSQTEVATSGDVYIGGELEVNGKEYIEGGTEWEKGSLAENITVRSLTLEEISSLATTTEEELTGLPEEGDILIVDPLGEFGAVKSFEKNSNKILGVVATDPAGIMRGDLGRDGDEVRPLAMSGSLPVKVSLENGPIKKGDLLTTASRPGYAMKALKPGAGIIGIALEDYLVESVSTSTAAEMLESAKAEKENERQVRAESETGVVAGAATERVETAETIELKKSDKIMVLLSVKNNVEVAWDEVAIAVIDNPSLNQEVSVADYSFQGNVVIKDLVVTGKVVVLGEAEFASAVTMKNNLNLEGALVRIYTEGESENLVIGDAVYIKGNKLVGKAVANADVVLNIFRPAIGMVVGFRESQEGGARTVEVAVGGAVKGFRNLVPGAVYYLSTVDQQQSASVASLANNTTTVMDIISLSLEKPTSPDGYIQTMAMAESEDSLLIMPSLSYEAVDPNAIESSYVPVDMPSDNTVTTESEEPATTETTTSTETATSTAPVTETPIDGTVAGETTTAPEATEPVVEVVSPVEETTPMEVIVVE
ncbi:hypothetical protein GYA13_05085, partial [Candidatus Kuenenbacteria bacterium]|nr:hypothetical protein [Candidatus Kuenenbacteria bacterium]